MDWTTNGEQLLRIPAFGGVKFAACQPARKCVARGSVSCTNEPGERLPEAAAKEETALDALTN
jgi:hypothetical protein